MDLFSTTTLNRVVDATPVVRPAFFLNSFFKEFETSTTEDIKFDKKLNKRRLITPLVSPLVKGRIIREQGHRMGSVSPAYLKDKRVFDPNKYFKRTVGEKIGGTLTPEQRLSAAVGFAVAEQLEMWVGRLEQMAAETVRTGKIVLESQDYIRQEVDFGRDPDLTKILAGAAKWNASGDILGNIEDYGQAVFDKSGATATDVVMASDVWKAARLRFMADDAYGKAARAQMDMTVATLTTARAEFGPTLIKDGIRLVAIFGDYRLWVHAGKYTDPETELDVNILPSGWIVMASDSCEGVRHFGAIRDLKAGIQPREYFVKSWEEEEPSVRQMLGQSAPLLVPYRVDATFGAKVL